MRNIRLTIEYDGSRYDGWQRLGKHSGQTTIQGKLEEVLTKMTGEPIELDWFGAHRCRGSCLWSGCQFSYKYTDEVL